MRHAKSQSLSFDARHAARAHGRAATAAQAVLAALLGLFILYGVALAQPQVLHNAAHDGRHAFAFPCH